MSLPQRKANINWKEFLEVEEKEDMRHEFFQGEIYAMSGGTADHSRIAMNIASTLGNELQDKECSIFGSDLLVRIEKADALYYPDVSVVCGEEQYGDEKKRTLLNPKLIVEVLSESTAKRDRSDKFEVYRQLESLQEYVLVDQKYPLVEVRRLNEHGFWAVETYSKLDQAAQLASLDLALPLARIYHRVQFPTIG